MAFHIAYQLSSPEIVFGVNASISRMTI